MTNQNNNFISSCISVYVGSYMEHVDPLGVIVFMIMDVLIAIHMT